MSGTNGLTLQYLEKQLRTSKYLNSHTRPVMFWWGFHGYIKNVVDTILHAIECDALWMILSLLKTFITRSKWFIIVVVACPDRGADAVAWSSTNKAGLAMLAYDSSCPHVVVALCWSGQIINMNKYGGNDSINFNSLKLKSACPFIVCCHTVLEPKSVHEGCVALL